MNILEIKQTRNRLVDILGDFPIKKCGYAALALNDHGYKIIRGIVEVDNYCLLGISKRIPHYWNYDLNMGINICITASQFNIHLNEKLPEIYLWHGNDKRYKDGIFIERDDVWL